MVEKIKLRGQLIANYVASFSVFLFFFIFFVQIRIGVSFSNMLDEAGVANSAKLILALLNASSIFGLFVSFGVFAIWSFLIKSNGGKKYLLRYSYALIVIFGAFILSALSFLLLFIVFYSPALEISRMIK